LHHLAVGLDRGRLAEHVLHEQARAQDHPFDAACLEPLLNGGVAAAHHRFRIRLRHRAAAADPHQILGAGFERRVEHVVLLFDHAGIVPGDDEHALNAGERFFQRRPVGQFRHRGFGVRAEHLARFVRIANNTDRILSERLQRFHHRTSGIARRPDHRNRHRRFLPTRVRVLCRFALSGFSRP
jgi:hypothetical protein